MYVDSTSPHHMNLLNLENSWKLLRDNVFGPENDHPHELEKIGKEIVEKCKGLPLTILVIAGYLSKMARTLETWKDVVRILGEIIASHPDKCQGVLGLSYHHLPNHLKPCFLSMSCFPEDFQVETKRLIQLWIAEGYIRTSQSNKSLEEVAVDYLEDLIGRNLIMVRKRRFNGEIKACAIHDLLHEFCLIEAETTKFMHIDKNYSSLLTQKQNVRRFSFQIQYYSVDDCCKVLPPVATSICFSRLYPYTTRVKLFGILPICHPCTIVQQFFSHFNLLRVLAIFHESENFDSFPLAITTLFHLRYLQVGFNDDIPASI
ncbi:putative late blight resistance protein homolog R1B-16 [Nicotiana tabacum]|uniref:Late blight resistance protein homolog R1B-16 n=1 Tax=Nicotiana tabacum TaxID=4097 RepID=A0AC58SU06_TOBAC